MITPHLLAASAAYLARREGPATHLVCDRAAADMLVEEFSTPVGAVGVPVTVLNMAVVVVPGERGEFTLVGGPTEEWTRGASALMWQPVTETPPALRASVRAQVLEEILDEVQRTWPFTGEHYRGAPGGKVSLTWALRHLRDHVIKDVGRLAPPFDMVDHTGLDGTGPGEARLFVQAARNWVICGLRALRLLGVTGARLESHLDEWRQQVHEVSKP